MIGLVVLLIVLSFQEFSHETSFSVVEVSVPSILYPPCPGDSPPEPGRKSHARRHPLVSHALLPPVNGVEVPRCECIREAEHRFQSCPRLR